MTTVYLNIPVDLATAIVIYTVWRVAAWLPTVISWIIRRIPGA